jgi:cell division septum initiation protein DivIVA
VPLDPEQIGTNGLPRDAFGGFKSGAVEELLKRVAWDYRKLLEERKNLAEAVDLLERRVQELEPKLETLSNELEKRRNPEELSRLLLAAAQRAAHDLRASAQIDGEAALKKARTRAQSIEAEAQRRLDSATELGRLAAQVRQRLQTALDTILAVAPAEAPEGAGDTDSPAALKVVQN